MFFLISAIIFAILCVVLLGRALLTQIRYRRVRRTGVTVGGEVIDVTATPRYNGGMTVRPVVRYRVDGTVFEATVMNRVDKPPMGSGLDIVVDPDAPETPWAISGSSVTSTIAALSVLLILALVLLSYAASLLH